MPTQEQWVQILAPGVLLAAQETAPDMGFARAAASKVIVTEYTGCLGGAYRLRLLQRDAALMVWVGSRAGLVIAGCIVVVRERSA